MMHELSIQPNVKLGASGEPNYKLFSARQVAAVTLFGGVFAGGLLISYNYAKLGKTDEATRAAALSLIASILLGVASFVAFAGATESQVRSLSTPLSVTIAFAMAYVVKQLQGESLDEHFARSGKSVSFLLAAALCVIALIFIFGMMVLASMFVVGY